MRSEVLPTCKDWTHRISLKLKVNYFALNLFDITKSNFMKHFLFLRGHFNKFPSASMAYNRSSRLLISLALLVFITHQANAQFETYISGFSQVQVVNGLSNPTSIAFAPDGRIFVTEQSGKLRVIKNGSLLLTPFVQLNNVYSSGEAGLTGVALDPNFAVNGYVYLYYTVPSSPYNNRISRFTANGDVSIAGSETLVLNLDPLSFAEQHNSGAMNFGSDGKLYIAVGDSHNSVNSQNLDSYLGKILRVNSDGSVPVGNPFTTGSEQRKRIWAYGLRNPFTFDIQPGTGRIFVNDVGEVTWEEINDATASGQNFGWPLAEGVSTNVAYTNPVLAYPHNTNFPDWGCAITGGAFFNPATTTYPASFNGKYFYQDYCTSAINVLDFSTSTPTHSAFGWFLPGQPVGLKVGIDGNVYFLSRSNSALYKIIYTTNTAPQIVTHPANVTVAQGQPAGFSVTATGTAPLSYQWQKNGSNITGATSASYTIASTAAADAGQYRVTVSNSVSSVTSNIASLSVIAPNQSPTPTILSPANHTLYKAGDVISFSGSATDPEDGTLPASAFAWTVEFHHNTHYHPGPSIPAGVTSGQFTIANQGEVSANVFYRLILTVTDSKGATGTTYIDIDPRVVTINLATNPTGLTLNLDGQPVTTPHAQQFVSGLMVGLTAPTSQTVSNKTYLFDSWDQGIGAGGTITIPDVNTTYTATYNLPVDLTPIVHAQPSILYGTGNFSVVVDVFELKSVATNHLITVKVAKSVQAPLSFPATATSVGGRPVQNSNWIFDNSSDEDYYILTKQSMSAGSVASFGLNGTLIPGPTSGTLVVTAVVNASSNSEVVIFNNTDADKIEYFQQ
ncbi:sorbosone dehydrogenase family protein [Spirosoma sp. KNUC1025]|uniref:PQQ-dependent sugar dehydrogenase n=1 Tax=Spirosoma sp. KNUC1025 TaxID=2894082 RepID=UPI00386FD9DF|nr:PQQ-dependent sugar dehydrogenase [Spirosoma sp. KNUC1025]